jgi:hypothetical protein
MNQKQDTVNKIPLSSLLISINRFSKSFLSSIPCSPMNTCDTMLIFNEGMLADIGLDKEDALVDQKTPHKDVVI